MAQSIYPESVLIDTKCQEPSEIDRQKGINRSKIAQEFPYNVVPRQRSNCSLSEEISETDPDHSSNLSSSDADEFEVSLSTTGAEKAIRNYVLFSLFHVTLIEGPMAVVESIFRSIQRMLAASFYLILAVLKSFLSCKSSRDFAKSRECFFEAVLFLLASVTLMLPASAALFVYGDLYSAWKEGRLVLTGQGKEAWVLSDVPTVLGPLNANKFTVFTQGQGFYAQDVQASLPEQEALIV